jgi:hypothetical protein
MGEAYGAVVGDVFQMNSGSFLPILKIGAVVGDSLRWTIKCTIWARGVLRTDNPVECARPYGKPESTLTI